MDLEWVPYLNHLLVVPAVKKKFLWMNPEFLYFWEQTNAFPHLCESITVSVHRSNVGMTTSSEASLLPFWGALHSTPSRAVALSHSLKSGRRTCFQLSQSRVFSLVLVLASVNSPTYCSLAFFVCLFWHTSVLHKNSLILHHCLALSISNIHFPIFVFAIFDTHVY